MEGLLQEEVDPPHTATQRLRVAAREALHRREEE
jgi:hypothetical protein